MAALGGLLLLLAYPPYSLWPLAPLSVAVLLLAVRRTGRWGGLVGTVYGAAFFVPLLAWSGVEVGPLPWLLLAGSQALFLGGLGAALAATARLPAWPLVAACLWVAQEALRARLPYGGFPWGRLGFASAEAPWAHLAALGGVPLAGFGVALAGALLAAALESRRRPAAGVALAAAAGGVLVAPLLVPLPNAAPAGSAVVAVVQGNVPRLGLDFNAERQAVLDNHVRATRDLAAAVREGVVDRPDLVVWPENGSDLDPFTDPAVYALIDAAVRDVGVPVLVGAILYPSADERINAGIVWDPVTGPGQRYAKRHPVPFAEYIPLRSLARMVSSDVDLVPRDMVAGESPGILDMSGAGPRRLVLGDVICFEVGYDGLVRDVVSGGGQLLAVQTNNATFGFTPQSEQQLVMSRLRAIEHGRSVLVAATSGVSAVVAPDGQVLRRAELFTPALLVERVPLVAAQTPATRLGAAPEVALAGVGALALLGSAWLPGIRRLPVLRRAARR